MMWPVATESIIDSMMQSAQTAYSQVAQFMESRDGGGVWKSYFPKPRTESARHISGVAPLALPLTGHPESYLEPMAMASQTLATPSTLGGIGSAVLLLPVIGLGLQSGLEAFESKQTADENSAQPMWSDATDSTEESENETSAAESTQMPAREAGAAYARVSSQKQIENGDSLEDQVTRLTALAEEEQIQLVHEPITDGAETGTDFDRPGIREVAELAMNGEISHLLVDEMDRVGRNAAESLHYIYQLRQCGVTIITAKEGEVDVDNLEGLAIAFMKSLSAQMENETRARRVKEARIEQFRKKNWLSAFKQVPFGYSGRDDGWIMVDEEESKVFQRAVKFFLETSVEGAYQRTVDVVGLENYGVNRRRLKVLLQRPVYIGEPTYRRGADAVQNGVEDTVTVEDDELQVISESRFERVQGKVDDIYERYSSGKSETNDVEDYVESFGLDLVQHVCDLVELRCPEPNCRGELVKNGTRTTNGEDVHNYVCSQCGRQRKFPKQRELDNLRNLWDDA